MTIVHIPDQITSDECDLPYDQKDIEKFLVDNDFIFYHDDGYHIDESWNQLNTLYRAFFDRLHYSFFDFMNEYGQE